MELISISIGLNQTPAYTVRLQIGFTWSVLFTLQPFHQYDIVLLAHGYCTAVPAWELSVMLYNSCDIFFVIQLGLDGLSLNPILCSISPGNNLVTFIWICWCDGLWQSLVLSTVNGMGYSKHALGDGLRRDCFSNFGCIYICRHSVWRLFAKFWGLLLECAVNRCSKCA